MNIVEKFARALCYADGNQNPDEIDSDCGMLFWQHYKPEAVAAVIVFRGEKEEFKKKIWDYWYGEKRGKVSPEDFSEFLQSS